METVIVVVIVVLAALWSARRLFVRRDARRDEPGSCSGACSSCAFAARGCGSRKDEPGSHRLSVLGALALAAALPDAARAADTIETWDPGAWDAEAYVGFDGLGAGAADRAAVGDVVLGYGLATRLSAYVAGTLETDGALRGGEPELRAGVFGTPLDLAWFDLDLLLEVGASGAGMKRLELAPGIEANLDLDSPVGPWGIYLRAAAPLGREEHVHPDGSTTYRTGHSFDFNPGIYWTVREGHQLSPNTRWRTFPVPARCPMPGKTAAPRSATT
jgi:hypothetical protein